jgi:hypothetical protein
MLVFAAVQERIRKDRGNGAHLVESRDLLGGQLQMGCAQIVLELAATTRTDDGQRSLGGHPGDGHLPWRSVGLLRDRYGRVENPGALRAVLRLEHAPAEPLQPSGLATSVFGCEHAATQR